jgi:hypothetical protein
MPVPFVLCLVLHVIQYPDMRTCLNTAAPGAARRNARLGFWAPFGPVWPRRAWLAPPRECGDFSAFPFPQRRVYHWGGVSCNAGFDNTWLCVFEHATCT